jgi:hypothetical protein
LYLNNAKEKKEREKEKERKEKKPRRKKLMQKRFKYLQIYRRSTGLCSI